MSVRRRVFVRRRSVRPGPEAPDHGRAAFADRVRSELALDLPDEDVVEDLDEQLDLYRRGSKPRCEEIEYLDLVVQARDRIARGG